MSTVKAEGLGTKAVREEAMSNSIVGLNLFPAVSRRVLQAFRDGLVFDLALKICFPLFLISNHLSFR